MDAAAIAFLASLAMVAIGWFGRWDATIAGGMLIAVMAAFAFDAPLRDQGLPTIIVAALVTQYRIGAAKAREDSLRRFEELKAQVEKETDRPAENEVTGLFRRS